MSKQKEPKQLKKVSGTDALYRSVFEIDYQGRHLAIDVDFFDWDEKVKLYVDGEERDEKTSPAKFDVGNNARIEAKMGSYGMEYVRLVDDAGEHPLTAAEGTGEAWRAKLDRDYPGLSRAIAITSWIILAIAAVTTLPILLQVVLNLVGSDVEIAPLVEPPGPLDTWILIAAIVAGIERGLRFKSGEFL